MVKLAQKQLYQVFQVCWLHSLQLDRSIFLPSAKFYDSGSPQFKLEMPLQLPMLRLDYDEDNEISNFQSLRVSLRFLKQSYHSDDLSIFFWLAADPETSVAYSNRLLEEKITEGKQIIVNANASNRAIIIVV